MQAYCRLLIVISTVSVRIVSTQVHQCPCSGELGDDANIVEYAGSCFLVQRTAKVTWHNATTPEHGASSSCVQEYTLAALIDLHLRMALAHTLAQEASITAGMRLRVALAKDDDGSTNTWHWITDAQRNVSANGSDSHLTLWHGEGHLLESELHTSAVLDVHSGQLVTASVDEPLAAIWTTTPRTVTDFKCKRTVIGAGTHASVDTTFNTHLPKRHCPIECHNSKHCRAYSIVPIDETSYNCVLHTAYSSESVHISSNVKGGIFCTKFRDVKSKPCSPLSLGENATVAYSSTPISQSTKYKESTTATINLSCASGTYFYHNKETQVQVACDGDTGYWMHWDAAMYMCIRLTKLWLLNPYFTPKWQEWQPGAMSVTVPQGSQIDNMTLAQGTNAIAVYYKGHIYFIMPSLGHVYKVDPATPSISRQADITAEYRHDSAAGAQLPNGGVLVCGGADMAAACFVHWPATGATQWSTPMVGGPRRSHAMCYYRHRVYVIGGLGGSSLASVISTDAVALDGWRDEPPMAGCRYLASATVFRGLIYVCAGFCAGAGGRLDTCEYFDGAAWTNLTSATPQPLFGGTLSALDERTMYIAGGNPSMTAVSAFDATTQTWADEPFRLAAIMLKHCAIEVW